MRGADPAFARERQLTIFDTLEAPEISALEAGERPSRGALELLGESEAFAGVIVELLERNGWRVRKFVRPFAGEGVALVAACTWAEARGRGETFGEALRELLTDVTTYYGLRQAQPA